MEHARRLAELEKPKAKERQKAGGGDQKSTAAKEKIGSGKLPEPIAGQTRDKVGAALGVSGKTADKLLQIGEAVEKELIFFKIPRPRYDRILNSPGPGRARQGMGAKGARSVNRTRSTRSLRRALLFRTRSTSGS